MGDAQWDGWKADKSQKGEEMTSSRGTQREIGQKERLRDKRVKRGQKMEKELDYHSRKNDR